MSMSWQRWGRQASEAARRWARGSGWTTAPEESAALRVRDRHGEGECEEVMRERERETVVAKVSEKKA